MRGRKPMPTALRLFDGNSGKRTLDAREPDPPRDLPSCPAHLSPTANTDWKRLARNRNVVGLLTLAAYCQLEAD